MLWFPWQWFFEKIQFLPLRGEWDLKWWVWERWKAKKQKENKRKRPIPSLFIKIYLECKQSATLLKGLPLALKTVFRRMISQDVLNWFKYEHWQIMDEVETNAEKSFQISFGKYFYWIIIENRNCRDSGWKFCGYQRAELSKISEQCRGATALMVITKNVTLRRERGKVSLQMS